MPYDVMFSRQMLIRGALEATYGQDANPSGDDTILTAFNVQFDPNARQRNTNPAVDAYFGHPGDYLGQPMASLSFSTFAYPAAAPDDKPGLDLLLQSAGHAATITAGESVAYNPIQRNVKSATFHLVMRDRLHKITGGRCSLSISGKIGEAVTAAAQFRAFPVGLPASTSFPTAPRPAKPCAMTTDNSGFTLNGIALDVVNFDFSQGQEIAPLNTSNRQEVVLRNRAPVLNVTVLEPPKSVLDYHALMAEDCNSDTPAEAVLTFPGFELTASHCQIGQIQEGGDYEGVSTITIPLLMRRNTGNDEYILKSVGGA